MTDSWGKSLFATCIGGFATWLGWRLTRTKKGIEADEDNAFVSVIDKMIPVIDKIQAPLMHDLQRVNERLDVLTTDYIKIQIKLGVMEKLSEEKDRKITELETENKRLRIKIKELEAA